jgi:uncharacterized protein YegL
MKVVFLTVLCIIGIYGQQFSAQFSAYNDPNIVGVMSGTINYDQPGLRIRNDYNLPSGTVNEVLLYGDPTNQAVNRNKVRYLHCTTCSTETYQAVLPQYYGGSPTGNTLSINGRTCNEQTISGNPVAKIWTDGNGICRALYTNGKTVDFTQNGALNAAVFNDVANWGCPQQTCNKEIDFVLIFDESGSIDGNSFRLAKNFAQDIGRAYVFGSQNTGMALVMFSTNARTAVQITFIQASFINGVGGVTQRGGSTCIGCGVDQARSEIAARGRSGVQPVFIVMTDGENNVGDFRTSVNNAKAARVIFFAIGVAQANTAQIQFISSTITGVQTAFTSIPDFSYLSTIVNNLVIATCVDIPGNPCGSLARDSALVVEFVFAHLLATISMLALMILALKELEEMDACTAHTAAMMVMLAPMTSVIQPLDVDTLE